MTETTVARELLWPTEETLLARIVFLYVGQGSSTIAIVKDGDQHKVLLIDINLDKECGGINVPVLLRDLLDGQGLYAFINTHPHNDHLSGLQELTESIDIEQVWHSGHIPSTDQNRYSDLKDLINKVEEDKGKENIITLLGSKTPNALGEVEYYILAPAEYVTDEIKDEKPETRAARIHEHCGVLRFGKGNIWVLIPGDADLDAFEKHITDYHRERLPSQVLAAPHHGSRSFFKRKEDDDPYLEALEAINPVYTVISAPTAEESQHNHPHEDAVKIYSESIKEDNVLHTGEKRYCFICDIYEDGDDVKYNGIEDDKGGLVDEYGLNDDSDDNGDGEEKAFPTFVPRTKVDERPMGNSE